MRGCIGLEVVGGPHQPNACLQYHVLSGHKAIHIYTVQQQVTQCVTSV
jgi:hypothetical protein